MGPLAQVQQTNMEASSEPQAENIEEEAKKDDIDPLFSSNKSY